MAGDRSVGNPPRARQKSRKSGEHTKKRGSSGGGRTAAKANSPGLQARELGSKLVIEVLEKGRSFDEARAQAFEADSASGLSQSDKGLARLIAATVLRRKLTLDLIVDAHLERPLPNRYFKVRMILLCASAQLLFLKTPPHAAISLAVEQTRLRNRGAHLTGLVNAVLRKVARDGPSMLEKSDISRQAIPDWLWQRWVTTFGESDALKIAQASVSEPALDLTIKSNAEDWAPRLEANVLATGSLRRPSGGRIEKLEGFNDGAWWVQDAAAALPARLLGDVSGAQVADLCAAPGGKTAQLAANGAKVVAVDNDPARIERIKENLERLHLSAELVASDVTTWKPDQKFEFVLVDAPCTATGTIRRHPDILHLKREGDILALARRQRELLDAAFSLLADQGAVVFCTCSLEPEEGETLVKEFLATTPNAQLSPIKPGEFGIKPEWLTGTGMLRTLPFHDPRQEGMSGEIAVEGGMDGFFAARIVRIQ